MEKHNVYVKFTSLSNVTGRIDYITNPKRQENIVTTYHSVENNFKSWWKDYADHCDEQDKLKNHFKDTKVCQGRELIFDLSLDYATSKDPEKLAKEFSNHFKTKYGVENVVAIHWNKNKTNYHMHLILAEAPEINEIELGAVLTRNTYYNANGKRSTKKECIDPVTKELLEGCTFYKKGEQIKTVKRWGTKVKMGSKDFSNEVKEWFAKKQNEDLNIEKYQVFKEDELHLKQQHVGKGLPESKKQDIIAKNNLVKEWNKNVDEALKNGVDEDYLKGIRNDLKAVILENKDDKTYAFKSWRTNLKLNKNYIIHLTQKAKTQIKQQILEPIKDVWDRYMYNLKVKKEISTCIFEQKTNFTLLENEIINLRNQFENDMNNINSKNNFFNKKKKELEKLEIVSKYNQNINKNNDSKIECENEINELELELNHCLEVLQLDKNELMERVKNPKFLEILKNENNLINSFFDYNYLKNKYGSAEEKQNFVEKYREINKKLEL